MKTKTKAAKEIQAGDIVIESSGQPRYIQKVHKTATSGGCRVTFYVKHQYWATFRGSKRLKVVVFDDGP